MARDYASDQQFAALWQQTFDEGGTVQDIADRLEMSLRATFIKRRKVEKSLGLKLSAVSSKQPLQYLPTESLAIDVSGTVIVCSDVHLWPDHHPFAWYCLLEAVKLFRPVEVWINGDLLDLPSASRHPRRGWEERPTIKEEVDWAQREMKALTKACDKIKAKKRLTRGNHDDRFENYLVKNAQAVEGLPGTTLEDLYEVFDGWLLYESLVVNDILMVKHALWTGIHAGYNNVLKSGLSTVTGHTHRLLARPWGDYRGVRFGIETGFLGEIQGPQFRYVQGSPVDWHPGFCVLHLEGDHISPEFVHTHGKIARVAGRTLHREDYSCSLI